MWRPLIVWTSLALLGCGAGLPVRDALRTPAEANVYARPSTSAEVSAFLADVARGSEVARVVPIGHSWRGTPMEALILSREPDALLAVPPRPTRLTVLLVGSQHGTEPSGTEALLALARDVEGGERSALLDDLNLVLVPNANPDGRDAHRRVNGNGVNLSTNFVTLSEPDARAVHEALRRWRPDVVLDVHESAVEKPKTLAREGFLTDVEAQFDLANNPNIDAGISTYAREEILPAVVLGVQKRGLRAQRYLGEITTISGPVSHSGLTAKNLRNHAGLLGSFSFLLENRLDPKNGSYQTPRNLGGRVAKQRLSVDVFLEEVRARREDIRRLVLAGRESGETPPGPTSLVARYALDPSQPEIQVSLVPVGGGAPVLHTFPYFGRVHTEVSITPPRAYVVTAHPEPVRAVLDRHGIEYRSLGEATPVTFEVQRIESSRHVDDVHGWAYTEYRTHPRRVSAALPPGSLWVPLDQSARRLLPLLLDPRSNSSMFQTADLAPLVEVGSDFFIVAVPGP